MEPIISPWWFYLAGFGDKAIFVCAIVLIASPLMFLFSLSEAESEKMPAAAKACVVAFICSAAVIIFIPSTDTVNKMIAASYVTPDNLRAAQGNIAELISQIADAIGKAK